MRQRSDGIFLLTLVDFLIQIIFFGLMVFVAYRSAEVASQKATRSSPEKVRAAIEAAGVSDMDELTDELSRLAPIRLKGFNDAVAKQGGGGAADAVRMIAEAGGAQGMRTKLDRLAKLENGLGKPPCLFDLRAGRRVPRPIASVVASGSTIRFAGETPDLRAALGSIGVGYADVEELSLSRFAQIFRKLPAARPECRYSLVFRETTRLVDARDVAGRYFYLMLRR